MLQKRLSQDRHVTILNHVPIILFNFLQDNIKQNKPCSMPEIQSVAQLSNLHDAGVKCSTILPGSVAIHFNHHEPKPSDVWKIQPEDSWRFNAAPPLFLRMSAHFLL